MDNIQKIEKAIEKVQLPAGYTVSVALTSTPIWLEDVITWFEFGVIVVGLLVGLTTLWLNIVKIRKAGK